MGIGEYSLIFSNKPCIIRGALAVPPPQHTSGCPIEPAWRCNRSGYRGYGGVPAMVSDSPEICYTGVTPPGAEATTKRLSD